MQQKRYKGVVLDDQDIKFCEDVMSATYMAVKI